MNTAIATEAMILFLGTNRRDINHFMMVYGFAKAIGEMEKLDERTQQILEITAIIHDIPCPLCREKYGSTNGKMQEKEGPALTREFLKPLGFDEELIERAAWLVGHHHTYTDVDGLDHQILLEADFLVNAHEQKLPQAAVENMEQTVFKTAAGKQFLKRG